MLSSRSSPFGSTGPLSRAAGLPAGMFVSTSPKTPDLAVTWSALEMRQCTSKPFTSAAEKFPSGWVPKEPQTSPNSVVQAAGVRSVLDNTMRFSPLPSLWGKTRETSEGEVSPSQRLLAPDTLASAKGLRFDSQVSLTSSERMASVLPRYAPSTAVFSKYEPERLSSGFITTPKAHAGSSFVDEQTAQCAAQSLPRTPHAHQNTVWMPRKIPLPVLAVSLPLPPRLQIRPCPTPCSDASLMGL